MHLDDAELGELARFLARRFDLELHRLDGAPSASLEQAWTERLQERRDAGRLPVLFAQLRNRHPEDTNLRDVVELLAEPSRGADQAAGFFLMAAAAAVLFFGTAGVGAAGAVWLLDGEVQAVEAPVAPVLATLEGAEMSHPERAEQDTVPGRCGGGPGEVVGYWYAGATAPTGEVLTMPETVNVRAAYPERANDWDARSPIRCVLHAGDLVRLSQQPVHVDGDRYWVPLVAGDLLPSRS